MSSGNLMGIRGFKSFCIDYPYDWTDKYRDTCYHYEEYEWCTDETIVTANVSVQDIIDETDFKYGFNANEVCCECGGGAKLLGDNVMMAVQSSVNNEEGLFTNNDLLCSWKHGSAQWRQYNNLELFDLCIKLRENVYKNYIFIQDQQLLIDHINDIDCNIFTDKRYPSETLKLCNDYQPSDGPYFMALLAVDDQSTVWFVNADWFNITRGGRIQQLKFHSVKFHGIRFP